MAKTKALTFPKKLYVKIDGEKGEQYFLADSDFIGMVDVGERVKIGIYELTKTSFVAGKAEWEGE